METVPQFSPAAVLCLALLIVVAVNGGLILAVRRGGTQRQVELLRRVAKAAKNPWVEQEKAMSELRERVAQIESEKANAPEPDD
ncbi:MAG: hypothetical protein ACE5M4_02420 [Anaerolineales bacterium]